MSVSNGEDLPPEKGQEGIGKSAAGRNGFDQTAVGEDVSGQDGVAPVESPAMTSIIGPEVVVVGDLRSQGPVQIEGRVEGDVDSPAGVVGKEAYVEGSVSGERVRILGAVAGWVRGGKVSIAETGRVDGCIQHTELVSETSRGGFALSRLIPASLTERQRWLLVRNLALAVTLLLLIYFLGNSGRWAFIHDLPSFLAPILGDRNVVVFLAFGSLILLGYAGARAQLAADGSLRRRLVDLERKQERLRRIAGLGAARAVVGPDPEALAEVTERVAALERRIAGLAGEGPAKRLDLPAKSAGRPRHRKPSKRNAGP